MLSEAARRGDDIAKVQPEESNAQALLTLREVARLLHVHPNSVRRWADMGLITTYRIGIRGDRRFRPEDVDTFLNARRKPERSQQR